MEYTKEPLSFDNQIKALESRGLKFENIIDAKAKLHSVSYYRLRAYTFPFQDNENPNHPFVADISFEDVFSIYKFDHKLRSLIFKMLDIIEVAFRTQIIHHFAIQHGAHWQLKEELFHGAKPFKSLEKKLESQISQSKEDFIIHYTKKYNFPKLPPSWMSLEVISFGLLSKIFQC